MKFSVVVLVAAQSLSAQANLAEEISERIRGASLTSEQMMKLTEAKSNCILQDVLKKAGF